MASGDEKGNPGVVYVGRIPHGFYESEMRQYFSQFGTITKLRLSRNRKTGHSKHFAFLEFESNEVAKIVAETMNNYLMYGHILKCKYVEPEALHPDAFKGANKRFRVAPYNRMEKRALEAPKSETQWTKKNQREQADREKKAEKLKAMGYEIDLPKLQSPSEVLQQKESQSAEQEKAPDHSGPASNATPTPTTLPNNEIPPKKRKSKKETEIAAPARTDKTTTPAATSNNLTSEPVHSQNVVQPKSEKKERRKEKRENTKGDPKQLAAEFRVDETTGASVKTKPAKTGAEATMAISDLIRPSPSSKKRKRAVDEDQHVVINETAAAVTAETAPVEEEALPSTLPAESRKDGISKKSRRKRSSNVGNKLPELKQTSTKPAARDPKAQEAKRAPKTEGSLKKAKKA